VHGHMKPCKTPPSRPSQSMKRKRQQEGEEAPGGASSGTPACQTPRPHPAARAASAAPRAEAARLDW